MKIALDVVAAAGMDATIVLADTDKDAAHNEGSTAQDAYLLHLVLRAVLPAGTYIELARLFVEASRE